MVRFDRFPTKNEAWTAIWRMRNEVFLGGAPFDAVARRGSQGYTASQGGKQDWTSQGSLKSKELDHALFHWPPLRLSDPIEDRDGFHVIRILERHDAGRTPFSEVQDEIEEKLRRQYRNDQVKKYLAKVKENALVRTVYDNEQQPGSSSQTAPARQSVSRRNTGGRFRP